MFKFLFQRHVKEERLDRAISHSHQHQQQTVIRGRAGKIIADQRAKSLQTNEAAKSAIGENS